MKSRQVGIRGEEYAEKYLRSKGFQVRAKNWYCRRGELDIVALDGKELVFVEVKTRRSRRFGLPEDAFTDIKQRRMLAAVFEYLQQESLEHVDWRVDFIAVELNAQGILLRLDHYPYALNMFD